MGEADRIGADGPRWIYKDDFIAEAVAAGYQRQAIRDALAEIAESRGFACGQRRELPGRPPDVWAVRVRGRRAWDEAQLVDANALWSLVGAELGDAPSEVTDAPKATIGAETKCHDWLVQLMKGSPSGSDRSKTVIKQQALSDFPGLSARGFTRAWKAAIEETGAENWSAAGRKSIKSSR